ncbi:MAG: septum formation initiator family protein [Propionibacteriaceae bacterium]|nr:septum formation initiator family protein [Propionibacteriaceae bacterium]
MVRNPASSPESSVRSQSRESSAGLSLVQRTIAVAATFALLLIFFVSRFSVYLSQQRDIAEVRADIAAHRVEIARLQDELDRWQDPAYVKAQARDRLGWVMPGEVGYRVVDENGQLIGGFLSGIDDTYGEVNLPWYEVLGESLIIADQPTGEVKAPGDTVVYDPSDGETPR